MPLLADRVQETTTTSGTGTLSLSGAVTGYRSFNASFTNGDVVFYTIDDTLGNWEVGFGTVGTGTLTRTTVIVSSNSNNLVNFGSGNKRVFCTAPTRTLLPDQTGNSGKILSTDGTSPSWIDNTVGTVTSVSGTGTVNGLTLTGTVTSSGSLTLGGTLSGIANSALTNSSITFGSTSVSLGGTVSGFNGVSIGASSASTGAFTTLSASSTVSGTGFSTYLASPPAIGGITPAAGAFSNLSYTGTLTGGTGVIAIGTNQIYKDASGNVGIGTSSPGAKLDVQGGRSYFASNSDAFAAYLRYNASTNGVFIGSPSANAFQISNSGGAAYLNISSSGVLTLGSAVSLDPTTANALVLNSSGNVGIGTASPAYKLDIQGTTSTKVINLYTLGVSGDYAAIGAQYAVGNLFCQSQIRFITENNVAGTGALSFLTGSNSVTERLRISSTGVVTVGSAVSLDPTTANALVLNSSGQLLVGQTTTSDVIKLGLTQSTAYNSNTYNLMSMKAASAAAYDQLQSTSVSTSATVILSSGLYASFMIVYGSDGTNRFIDLVLAGLGNGSITTVSSHSVAGTPATRTYSQSASTYRLAMGSGTYSVQVRAISLSS